MNNNLTFHQRIHNAAGSQAVENCHARHSYYHAKAFSAEEWTQIWSQSKHATWGHFFGRMRGFDSVWFNSVGTYDARTYINYLTLYRKFREIIGKDPRPINEASVHCLVNDVIEVAEDGMSARSAYVTPGVIFSNINENEKRWCNFMWERYGSDYVFEDGNWLYLHEQVCPDIMAEFDDRNWANKAFCQELNPPEHMGPPHHRGGDGPGFDTSTELQDPGPLHFDYSATRPVQDTVPYPRPYKTMDNDNTYAQFIDTNEA